MAILLSVLLGKDGTAVRDGVEFNFVEEVVAADGVVGDDDGHGGDFVEAAPAFVEGEIVGAAEVDEAARDVGPVHAAGF